MAGRSGAILSMTVSQGKGNAANVFCHAMKFVQRLLLLLLLYYCESLTDI
jgi:hypothetical protein